MGSYWKCSTELLVSFSLNVAPKRFFNAPPLKKNKKNIILCLWILYVFKTIMTKNLKTLESKKNFFNSSLNIFLALSEIKHKSKQIIVDMLCARVYTSQRYLYMYLYYKCTNFIFLFYFSCMWDFFATYFRPFLLFSVTWWGRGSNQNQMTEFP